MTNSETTISAAQVTMDENDLGMTVPNRKLCDQVRDRIHDFEGRTRKEIVEIGALLIQVKGAVGHGAFKKWLDAEVRWTIRTAENYMNVAKNTVTNTKQFRNCLWRLSTLLLVRLFPIRCGRKCSQQSLILQTRRATRSKNCLVKRGVRQKPQRKREMLPQ